MAALAEEEVILEVREPEPEPEEDPWTTQLKGLAAATLGYQWGEVAALPAVSVAWLEGLLRERGSRQDFLMEFPLTGCCLGTIVGGTAAAWSSSTFSGEIIARWATRRGGADGVLSVLDSLLQLWREAGRCASPPVGVALAIRKGGKAEFAVYPPAEEADLLSKRVGFQTQGIQRGWRRPASDAFHFEVRVVFREVASAPATMKLWRQMWSSFVTCIAVPLVGGNVAEGAMVRVTFLEPEDFPTLVLNLLRG